MIEIECKDMYDLPYVVRIRQDLEEFTLAPIPSERRYDISLNREQARWLGQKLLDWGNNLPMTGETPQEG